MKERKTGNPDFINLWRKCKIEKLRDIERLCSVIMDVLQIAEKPSWNGIRAKETGNDDCAGKKHSPVKGIDWGNIFDKLERGEKVVEYTDFRDWYGMNWGGGGGWTRLFYKGEPSELDKEGFNHPLWIQILPYGENIDAFQTIRDDCKILSQLLESFDAACNGQYFKAVEDIVNGVIQGVFTLIGTHDKEHGLEAKVREYEAQAQKRKQAYENGPGAASAMLGGWNIKAAKKILDTCGGIAGYDALPHGKKGVIRSKIEKAIQDPDGRNVYNILKKIRNKQEQN